jgi:hypothetical protein
MSEVTLDFFTEIVKITVNTGPILVLDLTTGVAPPQSGPPLMQLTGVPGADGVFSVFTDNLTLVKPKGKTAAIVDPISGAMRANLLTWPKNRVVTAQSGNVFLFCNINLMRAQLGKGTPLTLQLITPGKGQTTKKFVTYYVENVNGSGYQFDPSNPGKPLQFNGGNAVINIWRDGLKGDPIAISGGTLSSDTPGSQNVFLGGRFNGFVGQVNPVNATFILNLDNQPISQYVPPGNNIVTGTVEIDDPDTTQWGITAAVWKKQKSFAGLLPTPPLQTFPVPPPAIQPDSKAFTGGFSVPSRTVTVAVSAAPENAVTLG